MDGLAEHLAAAERIVQRLTFTDLDAEFRLGHQLGYLRTFAAPRVAGLLARTGLSAADPRRRAVDTGLFVRELVHHGLESPEGREIIGRLAAMHGRYPIRPEEYRWVLTNFVLPGLAIADRYGWRPVQPEERQALLDWWGEVGRRLGAGEMPPDAEGWAGFAADYERAELAPTPAGQQLFELTVRVAVEPFPRPLRPLAVRCGSALLDERVRQALGLRPPGRLVRAVTGSALRLRAARRRRRGPGPVWFVSGAPRRDYPDGYALADLGPR